MYIEINHIDIKKYFLTAVRLCTFYIRPIQYNLLDGFFAFIGVQMAHPFLTDKKSGVMKSALETSCAILTRTIRPASGNTPKSRKSVLVCLESTTLQLGAGGETA